MMEMRYRQNTSICRNFTSCRNLQKPSYCLHTAEVAGSNPASPTTKYLQMGRLSNLSVWRTSPFDTTSLAEDHPGAHRFAIVYALLSPGRRLRRGLS